MKPLIILFSLFVLGSATAHGDLEISCARVLNAPEATQIHIQNERVVLLAGRIQELAASTDKILIQYEIFKVIEDEFKGIFGDSQKALAYLSERDGANDFTPDIASINVNARSIQKNVSRLQKILRPNLWRRIFAISDQGRKEVIAEIALDIQICRTETAVCSESIKQKSAALAQHIANVRNLIKDVDQSIALLKNTLGYLEKSGLNVENQATLNGATSGILDELQMTQTLLSTHLVQIENDVKSANMSLETLRALRPLLAGVVGLGAPASIFEDRKASVPSTLPIKNRKSLSDYLRRERSAKVSSKEPAGKLAKEFPRNYPPALREAEEAQVGIANMSPHSIGEAIWKVNSNRELTRPMKKNVIETYLNRLSEINSFDSTNVLADLYTDPRSNKEPIEAILLKRSYTEEIFTVIYDLIRQNTYQQTKALILLSMIPTDAATSLMIEFLSRETFRSNDTYVFNALKRRHYTNDHILFLTVMTKKKEQTDWTRLPWFAAEALESIGTKEALDAMTEILGRFQDPDSNDYLIGYSLELSKRVDRLKTKLENPDAGDAK